MEAARVVFPQSQLFFFQHMSPESGSNFPGCVHRVLFLTNAVSEWFGACHVSAGPLWPTASSIPGPVEYNPWHHTASVENANYSAHTAQIRRFTEIRARIYGFLSM